MRSLATSLAMLIRGVLSRAYFLVFALFLDPIDVYGRFRPSWTPEVLLPNWAFWAAFWIAFCIAILLAYHDARLTIPSNTMKVSILELRAYCVRMGWEIGGPTSLDVMDLADAIRQSAISGDIAIWGRLDRYGNGSMGLVKNEPRIRIPAEHFQNYWIEVTTLVRAAHNLETQTYQPGSNNWSQGSYRDLLIEMPNLKAWEREARQGFRGRREAEHAREEAARKIAIAEQEAEKLQG